MLSVSAISKRIFFWLGFLLVAAGCNNNIIDPNVKLGRKDVVPEEATKVNFFLSEGAKIKGKLTAPFMLRYQRTDSPYTEFPRSLHVDFYQDSATKTDPRLKDSAIIESILDARYGKYLQQQDKVYLRDSVVVKNILKGDTLKCKELWWDKQTEKFYTADSVRIYQKDKIMYGTGMEADQNFRWYTIKHLTGTMLTSGSNIPK